MSSVARAHALARGAVRPAASSSRAFVWLVTGSFACYATIAITSGVAALRPASVDVLAGWPALHAAMAALTPASLSAPAWDSASALVPLSVFALAALALVALWAAMLHVARWSPAAIPTRLLLAGVAACAIPLLLTAGMASSDLYLYAFFGRILAVYGENPLLNTPLQYWGDPHLAPVFWTWLPASYGPVWLMLSGALSRLAGENLTTTVLVYKSALLGIHLLTTWVLARALSSRWPERATWGAVFYGLNPLVLFEGIANGHNELLLVLLLTAGVVALLHARPRPLVAVALLSAAVMVKAVAVVLLAPVGVAILAARQGLRARLTMAAAAISVGLVVALALYWPLWAGTVLIDNVRFNPAATEYNNSLWEFALRTSGAALERGQWITPAERVPMLAVLLLGTAFGMVAAGRGRPLSQVLVWTWGAYLLSLGWVWPWYFVVAVPFAALAGPGAPARVTMALTAGGLLFWTGWTGPPHPLAPWLTELRALVLFAPAIVVAAVNGAWAILPLPTPSLDPARVLDLVTGSPRAQEVGSVDA